MWWERRPSFVLKVKKQFIVVTKFSVTWNDNKNEIKVTTFDNTSLKLVIIYLLYNCLLFNFVNFSCRQITRFSWVLTQNLLWEIYFYIILEINGYQILKKDLRKSYSFSNTFHFIDNVCHNRPSRIWQEL